MIGDSDIRSNGAAVDLFSKKLVEFADEKSKLIANIVASKKKKTAYEEDVEEAFSSASEEAESSNDEDASE